MKNKRILSLLLSAALIMSNLPMTMATSVSASSGTLSAGDTVALTASDAQKIEVADEDGVSTKGNQFVRVHRAWDNSGYFVFNLPEALEGVTQLKLTADVRMPVESWLYVNSELSSSTKAALSNNLRFRLQACTAANASGTANNMGNDDTFPDSPSGNNPSKTGNLVVQPSYGDISGVTDLGVWKSITFSRNFTTAANVASFKLYGGPDAGHAFPYDIDNIKISYTMDVVGDETDPTFTEVTYDFEDMELLIDWGTTTSRKTDTISGDDGYGMYVHGNGAVPTTGNTKTYVAISVLEDVDYTHFDYTSDVPGDNTNDDPTAVTYTIGDTLVPGTYKLTGKVALGSATYNHVNGTSLSVSNVDTEFYKKEDPNTVTAKLGDKELTTATDVYTGIWGEFDATEFTLTQADIDAGNSELTLVTSASDETLDVSGLTLTFVEEYKCPHENATYEADNITDDAAVVTATTRTITLTCSDCDETSTIELKLNTEKLNEAHKVAINTYTGLESTDSAEFYARPYDAEQHDDLVSVTNTDGKWGTLPTITYEYYDRLGAKAYKPAGTPRSAWNFSVYRATISAGDASVSVYFFIKRIENSWYWTYGGEKISNDTDFPSAYKTLTYDGQNHYELFNTVVNTEAVLSADTDKFTVSKKALASGADPINVGEFEVVAVATDNSGKYEGVTEGVNYLRTGGGTHPEIQIVKAPAAIKAFSVADIEVGNAPEPSVTLASGAGRDTATATGTGTNYTVMYATAETADDAEFTLTAEDMKTQAAGDYKAKATATGANDTTNFEDCDAVATFTVKAAEPTGPADNEAADEAFEGTVGDTGKTGEAYIADEITTAFTNVKFTGNAVDVSAITAAITTVFGEMAEKVVVEYKKVVLTKARSTGEDGWTTEVPTEAGDYKVRATIEGDETTNEWQEEIGTFTIAKADNAITGLVAEYTATYGDTITKPAVSANEATPVVSFKLSSDNEWTTWDDTNAPKNAGTYDVKAEVEATENYNGTSATSTLTISAKELTITWPTETEIKFTNRDIEIEATAVTGLIGNDDAQITYTYNGNHKDVGDEFTVTANIGNSNYKANTTATSGTYKVVAADGYTIMVDAPNAAVYAGEEFTIKPTLTVGENIYYIDFMLDYDAELFELVRIDGTAPTDTQKLGIVSYSTPANNTTLYSDTNPIVTYTFKAIAQSSKTEGAANDSGTFTFKEAYAGTVKDGHDGNTRKVEINAPTVEIAQKTLTVSDIKVGTQNVDSALNSVEVIFNGSEFKPSLIAKDGETSVELTEGTDIVWTIKNSSDADATIKELGDYTVSYKIAESGYYINEGTFTVKVKNGAYTKTLKVTKGDEDVSSAIDGAKYSTHYTGDAYTFTLENVLPAAEVTYKLSTAETYSETPVSVTLPGTHVIQYKIAATTGYEEENGSFTIEIKALPGTHTPSLVAKGGNENLLTGNSVTLTYSENGFTFSVTTDPTDATVEYTVVKTGVEGNTTYDSAFDLKDTGTYTINYTVTKDGYEFAAPEAITVKIDAAGAEYAQKLNDTTTTEATATVEYSENGHTFEVVAEGAAIEYTVTKDNAEYTGMTKNGNVLTFTELGTFVITYDITKSGYNYGTPKTFTLTISEKSVAVTENVTNATVANHAATDYYRAEGYTFSVTTGDVNNVTIKYTVKKNGEVYNELEDVTTAPTIIETGEYKITYTVEKYGYKFTGIGEFTLTIDPIKVNVTEHLAGVNDSEISNHAVTVGYKDGGYEFSIATGDVADVTITYASSGSTGGDGAVAAQAGKITFTLPGTYTITYTAKKTGYTFNDVAELSQTFTLTITAKGITSELKLDGKAVTKDTTYNKGTTGFEDLVYASGRPHTFTAADGTLTDEQVVYTVNDKALDSGAEELNGATLADGAITFANAGTYVIKYTITRSGYTSESGTVTVEIAKASIANDVSVKLDDGDVKNVVYAPEGHNLVAAVATAELDSEAITYDVQFNSETAQTGLAEAKLTNAGTYKITVKVATNNANYADYTSDVYTIVVSKAALPVTLTLDETEVTAGETPIEKPWESDGYNFKIETGINEPTYSITVDKLNNGAAQAVNTVNIKNSDTYAISYTVTVANVNYEAASGSLTVIIKDNQFTQAVSVKVNDETKSAEDGLSFNPYFEGKAIAYEVLVDGDSAPEGTVTYKVTKAGETETNGNGALDGIGEYTVSYTIKLEGYEAKAGSFTVNVKKAYDIVINGDYVSGAKYVQVLVFAYTDATYTYSDNTMIDVTAKGYANKYGKACEKVYAYITTAEAAGDTSENDDVQYYEPKVDFATEGTSVAAITKDSLDINGTGAVEKGDINAIYSTVNFVDMIDGDTKDVYSERVINILRADVDCDGDVDAIDAAAVFNEVHKNEQTQLLSALDN